MSRSALAPFKNLFRPPRPLWACEFTTRHFIAAGVDSSRKRVAGGVFTPLPANTVEGSSSGKNVINRQVVLDIARDTLKRAGLRGFEISVVIPDDSSRIAFLTAENLTGTDEERETFVRWKLKKSVPFDVDSSQIAYKILGNHTGDDGKGVDIMVALSPRSIVREYEELLEELDLHAGFVIPSTLAALNLSKTPNEDSLFVKSAPGSVTTTVFQNQRPRFYRRVADASLYDSIYPTILYYQDKLGGLGLGSVTLCGYDTDLSSEIPVLQNRLGIAVRKSEPTSVEDIYRPVLGAANLL